MPKLIPKMKYAFFGMSLESGTKTVAYINIFTYTVMVMIFVINAWLPDLTADKEEDKTYEAWAIGQNMRATFFLESTSVLQLVFSGFLLFGATVRDGKLLFSWILQQSGLIFHSQLVVIINFIALFEEDIYHRGHLISFIFEETAIIE
ncbi:Hypothetical protein NTJ_13633 [Nesidiocoris tenuis]|uniref:Uncharacterized protein n=1 Tax=Nesidiocoris tenuis TaxID=355587 RepID=A0ABN7BCE3_9HEMI|nr:Hypothetical protein NTJ_13633 [Nesidiocoris tenuis]